MAIRGGAVERIARPEIQGYSQRQPSVRALSHSQRDTGNLRLSVSLSGWNPCVSAAFKYVITL